ncbi:MAG: SCO family protein [Deltaproteobacteria bacterium]|nr:SCO family protein [Deltaproteobacteria bacterium]
MRHILPPCLAVFFFLTAFSHPLAASIDRGPAGVPPAGFVGVIEKLGDTVPGDIQLYNENGEKVLLGSLMDRPTVLTLAYFSCTNVCADIAANTAGVISRTDMTPGVDFSLITLSFDESDTPARALRKKRDYIAATGREFPEDGWRFLTGDAGSISRVASAVGYSFQRDGAGFRHPAAVIVLSPTGRIIRYLYGDRYLPFDFKMAVAEASAERPGASIPRALLFCYTFDPEKGRYGFNFIKVAGLAILLGASVFFIALTVAGRPGPGRGPS